MSAFVAAVDWGTSSLRVWLMAADGAVLDEARSDEGMMQARTAGFDAVLERHLADLGAAPDLPVMVCGMAGARQGWREAPYLDTPASLADIAAAAIRVDGAGRDVRILPGAAQRDPDWPDVMRGEETQLLGLGAQGIRSGLVCMPGTHSKWVELEDDAIRRFATFMTGDVFGGLGGHTILRLALEEAAETTADHPAFLDTVGETLAEPQDALGRLFAIRAGPLLGVRDAAEGQARLSGIVIGLELAGAVSRFGTLDGVVLVGSGRLGALYRAALETAGADIRGVDADEAVRAGLHAAALSIWRPHG